MNEREIVFWDTCPDNEELHCTEEEEALDYLFSGMEPGEKLPETVTLYGFARLAIEESDKNFWAMQTLDNFLDLLDEEHGSPDEGSHRTPPMEKAARAFVDEILKDYRVFSCEQVIEKEVKIIPLADDNWTFEDVVK